MSLRTNQKYLLQKQYQNSDNLDARITLHEKFSTNKQGWPRWVFDQFDFPQKCSILEVGCGPGTLWIENSDRLSETWNLTLTDFSEGMLSKVQETLSTINLHIEFLSADIQNLPFSEESFDAVIANHMLYHVPDLKKGISEIHRVLKPGGNLYASTNGSHHLEEMASLINEFSGKPIFKSNPFRMNFILETGEKILSTFFPQCELRCYKDGLSVTQTQPLLNHMQSTPFFSEELKDKEIIFSDFLSEKITSQGKISITKDSGIFIAEKAHH